MTRTWFRRAPVSSVVAFTAALALLVPSATGQTHSTTTPTTAPDGDAADRRLRVLQAMNQEMERSTERLQLNDETKPYFIRYQVREHDERELSARFGAIVTDDQQRARLATVEVRVGDYQFDNTADEGLDGGFDFDSFERYHPPVRAPLDDDMDALRATLWLQTDGAYKAALSALHKKRGKRVTTMVEDENLPSFSRETPAHAVDKPLPVTFDRQAWTQRLRRVSARLKKHPEIFDSAIKLSVSHQIRYLTTSEGTGLINERLIYALHVGATSRSADGLLIEHGKSVYGSRESELPDEEKMAAAVDQLAHEIKALRQAPMLDPYNGPAILLPEAAGVFFHEALGHRLEGERQNANNEGATFKGQIGKPILPRFLTIVDDPTLARMHETALNGHYQFDDEGVAARPVTLVERGILRAFLKSRTPVKDALGSNGHGRAEGVSDPMGRMANTIVKSHNQVPLPRLKTMLLEEIRRQKKDFGLIIADITGGQTNTTTYDFQAFKGVPRVVYRVDGKTGKETLVRGVEFVGTPIGSLNRIVATSNQTGVFNGYCGAESGFIPVSTVAPAVLISEIELQRSRRTMERLPILSPPWLGSPNTAPNPPKKPPTPTP